MLRYVPRLVPPGTTPPDALVIPLIENPPPSPGGEHRLIPVVAWMVERDIGFEHVPADAHPDLEEMRGSAIETMLDHELTNEALDDLPGVATTGTYAAELLLDHDHLTALHGILGAKAYLAAVPRRGRLLVGGVGRGIDGMRSFVEHVKAEWEAAPLDQRISPIALFVKGGAPTAVIGELQLLALAQTGER